MTYLIRGYIAAGLSIICVAQQALTFWLLMRVCRWRNQESQEDAPPENYRLVMIMGAISTVAIFVFVLFFASIAV